MRFAALKARWYKGYLAGGSLLMAGDNAEHAITYWAMWQAFHSPLLAGFAVLSHWLPHLFLSIPFGALADRFDARRIIQVALGLFMLASLGWGILLLTDSLQPWHCVVLLLVHGFASALWHPADKVMVYDIVGPTDLPSGVRLMATGLSLGQLVGPAFGAALLFTVGPAIGIVLNIALYLPFLVYLFVMPLDGHRRRGQSIVRLRFRDVFGVLRELPRYPAVLAVMAVQAAVGLLIGTALMPLFPEFGELLGLDQAGVAYGALIVAMATGAVIAGLTLETIGRIRVGPRLAIAGAGIFGTCVLVFALSRSFVLSLIVLVLAGAATIVTESTAQTVIQLEAPDAQRGRFVGAAQVTSLGSRTGGGLIIGVLGGIVGVSGAVAIDAGLLVLVAATLFVVARRLRPSRPVAAAAPAPAPAVE